jgi:hypothetical protein
MRGRPSKIEGTCGPACLVGAAKCRAYLAQDNTHLPKEQAGIPLQQFVQQLGHLPINEVGWPTTVKQGEACKVVAIIGCGGRRQMAALLHACVSAYKQRLLRLC